MLNITLIQPPGFSTVPGLPFDIVQVGAVLERDGHRVSLVDANLLGIQPADIPDFLSVPQVIIMAASATTIGTALRCAEAICEKFSGVRIIVFGDYPSVRAEQILHACPLVSAVVRGEPEDTFSELCRAFLDEKPLDAVAGIAFIRDDEIVQTPSRSVMVNLDTLPYPAWHLCDLKKYRYESPRGKYSPVIEVRTSRGILVPAEYRSDALYGKEFRQKSEDRVIDELGYLKERYKAREILFTDEWFTSDTERVRRLAERMNKVGLKLAWTCNTRHDMVDRNVVLNMKRSGCFAIEFPLLSASRPILETLGDVTAVEKAVDAVKLCHDNGLQVIGRFLLGAPGETPQSISQTAEYARSLQLDTVRFLPLQPVPGMPLYERYLAEGGSDVDWENLAHASIENPDTPVFESELLDRSALIEYQQKALKYLGSSGRKAESFDSVTIDGKNLLSRLRKPSGD